MEIAGPLVREPSSFPAHDAGSRDLGRSPGLPEQAVALLREQIVKGRLPAGTRINEVEAAAVFGISRGPLREAIQRLTAEGLLEHRPRRGAFVRSFTLNAVRQMFEVREALEARAAMLAAERATEADLAQLHDVLAETERLLASDPDMAYPSALDIHAMVLNLSGNPYLQHSATALQVQVGLARLKSGGEPVRARDALDEHRLIVDAIAARDPVGAGDAMTRHLRNSLANLLGMNLAGDRPG